MADVLTEIQNIRQLGNSLYFFDPLRSVEYASLELASKRMTRFYQTGTEFLIFLFTSDWFLGRDDFSALPNTLEESCWTEGEKKTIADADALFGNTEWRGHILNSRPVDKRERILVELYRERLHRWFRYVLPLPFNPKRNQIFHLILCSNYEAGIRATRDFYASKTRNPKYSPDNESAFRRFIGLHPELLKGLRGRERPREWRILWSIITQHEEGLSDCMCRDFKDIEPNSGNRERRLQWLADKGYLAQVSIETPWDPSVSQYGLNWEIVKKKLGVDPPSPLRPLSPEDMER